LGRIRHSDWKPAIRAAGIEDNRRNGDYTHPLPSSEDRT
jgi:hypothetical protein